MSDEERVLLFMRRCGGITADDAVEQFGCEDLDVVIAALRGHGHLIDTRVTRGRVRYEFTK